MVWILLGLVKCEAVPARQALNCERFHTSVCGVWLYKYDTVLT